MLGWPKSCKLAHAFLWKYSYKRLKLAKLLCQLGVFLTLSNVKTCGALGPFSSLSPRHMPTPPSDQVESILPSSSKLPPAERCHLHASCSGVCRLT